MVGMDFKAFSAAGWSPNSLFLALTLSPSKAAPNQPDVGNSSARTSPSRRSKAPPPGRTPIRSSSAAVEGREADKTFRSPMQSLVHSFGLTRFLGKCPADPLVSPDGSSPLSRHQDTKKTPSPTRFVDLTTDEANTGASYLLNPSADIIEPSNPQVKTVGVKPQFQPASKLIRDGEMPPPNDRKPLPLQEAEEVEIPFEKLSLDAPLPNGWRLFEHQKEAILQAVKIKRCILAYDMGLGKTLICIKWALELCTYTEECVCLVIAPGTVLETWRREASMLGFHVSSAHEYSNYPPTGKPRLVLASWAKIPSIPQLKQCCNRFVLIGDESHMMQSLTAFRTRAALELCLNKSCVGCILATGTPMKNGRPCNLLPLLIAIRHPIAKNRIEFEKRYCNARRTKFCAWDTTGATHLEELRRNVGSSLMRKTKVSFY